jgi:hypothetical protein
MMHRYAAVSVKQHAANKGEPRVWFGVRACGRKQAYCRQ